VNCAYRCPTGFWNTIAGLTGRKFSSSAWAKINGLNIAAGLGVTLLVNKDSIARGTRGVPVIVGVLDTNGVGVIDGLTVMVGVRLMVGVRVVVPVSVGVMVGGKKV
jgi:hypothetical protein